MSAKRYRVVILRPDGNQDVRASNVTLETAETLRHQLTAASPQLRVAIERHRDGMMHGRAPGMATPEP